MVLCPDDDTLLTPLISDNFLGTTLADKYQILEKLGTGGMGLVYKAKHLFMKRNVAIKLMLPQYASSATALKRFRQEAQAASHLNHPNILKVYDFGVTPNGLPYLVMDLLEGTNLSAELENEGHLPLARAINIFIQTCSALQHAHGKGVIHRDLKPGNIMLVEYEGERDLVQIVDFGMAKIITTLDGEKEELTKTGEVFGSPMYMSPEQCMGKELDPRSDIYSLGCVMYRTISGVPAVIGSTAMECFNKHANLPALPFSEVAPELNIPPSLEAIIFKAIAKDLGDRYQTMNEMKDALLKEIVGSQDISASLPAGTIRAYTVDLNRSIRQFEGTIPDAGSLSGAQDDTSDPIAVSKNHHLDTGNRPPAVTTAVNENTVLVDRKQTGARGQEPPFANKAEVKSEAFSQDTSPVAIRKKILAWSVAVILMTGLIYTLGTLSKKGEGPSQTNGTDANEKKSYEELIKTGQSAFNHGDYKQAGIKFDLALNMAKDKGEYDNNVPEAQLWLGKAYLENQNYTEAEENLNKVVELSEHGNRLNSPIASEALNDLGNLHLAKRQFKQCKNFYDKALSIRKTYKGQAYAEVAETLAGLGNLALAQGDFKKANDLLKQAVTIADTTKGLEETDIAKIYNGLAQTYQYDGKLTNASEYYSKALAIRQKNLNPEHPDIADTLTCLGTLEFRKRNLSKSRDYLQKALYIQEKSLPADDTRIANTKFCLGVLFQQMRKPQEAIGLIEASYEIRKKQLGDADPQTQDTLALLKQLKDSH
jgi:serine/threonine protein kinase/Tfp pilus assembly protein PilF